MITPMENTRAIHTKANHMVIWVTQTGLIHSCTTSLSDSATKELPYLLHRVACNGDLSEGNIVKIQGQWTTFIAIPVSAVSQKHIDLVLVNMGLKALRLAVLDDKVKDGVAIPSWLNCDDRTLDAFYDLIDKHLEDIPSDKPLFLCFEE